MQQMIESEIEKTAPLRESLLFELKSLLEMVNALRAEGRDIETIAIEAFIHGPSTDNSKPLAEEFDVIERQASFDAIPEFDAIELMINNPMMANTAPATIAANLERELNRLEPLYRWFESKKYALGQRNGPQQRWDVKRARREIDFNKNMITLFARALRRRIIAASIDAPLDDLYLLISEWMLADIPKAVREVMRAGDLLAAHTSTENTGKTGDILAAAEKPKPYEVDAYLSYVAALQKNPFLERQSLPKVYEWIKENGVEVGGADYDPPPFGTWQKYRSVGERHASKST